jgi:hypothetical protein
MEIPETLIDTHKNLIQLGIKNFKNLPEEIDIESNIYTKEDLKSIIRRVKDNVIPKKKISSLLNEMKEKKAESLYAILFHIAQEENPQKSKKLAKLNTEILKSYKNNDMISFSKNVRAFAEKLFKTYPKSINTYIENLNGDDKQKVANFGNLKDTVDDLKLQLQKKEKIEELQNKSSLLEQKVKQLNDEYENTKLKNEKKINEMKDIALNKFKQIKSENEKKLKKLKESIEKKEKDIEIQEKSFKTLKQDLDILIDNERKQAEKNEILKKSFDIEKKKLSVTEAKNKRLTEKIDKTESNLLILKKETIAIQLKNKQLDDSKTSLEKKITQLNKDHKKTVQLIINEKNKLERQTKDLKTENKKITDIIFQLKLDLQKMNDLKISLRYELVQEQNKISTIQSDFDKLEKAKKQLDAKHIQMKNDVDELANAYQDMLSRNNKQKIELQANENALQTLLLNIKSKEKRISKMKDAEKQFKKNATDFFKKLKKADLEAIDEDEHLKDTIKSVIENAFENNLFNPIELGKMTKGKFEVEQKLAIEQDQKKQQQTIEDFKEETDTINQHAIDIKKQLEKDSDKKSDNSSSIINVEKKLVAVTTTTFLILTLSKFIGRTLSTYFSRRDKTVIVNKKDDKLNKLIKTQTKKIKDTNDKLSNLRISIVNNNPTRVIRQTTRKPKMKIKVVNIIK